jgi:hydroxymethylpyrimidine/phosphomethylpyrimidine kinase
VAPPLALTIAGSDSCGGAGIQADLRTFGALGVLGTTAVTCLTAQNTKEVRAIYPVPPAFVRSQVEAVLEDMAPSAAKAGLLATQAIVKEVAAMADDLPPLVVDPVLGASSGRRFADDATVKAYRDQLFARAALITPNLPEAGELVGREVTTLQDARRAAVELGGLAPFVVIKGGHFVGLGTCIDVVWDGAACWELVRPRVATPNTHGAGCTFSAAVAAELAKGAGASEAVRLAKDFVYKALGGSANWRVGAGSGPLDHFGWEESK